MDPLHGEVGMKKSASLMATAPVEGQYSTIHWIETAASGNRITIVTVYRVYSARVN